MPGRRNIKRYNSYFKGWCQAFGEHEMLKSTEDSISWLFGDKQQIGLIIPPSLQRVAYKHFIGKHQNHLFFISHNEVKIGDFIYQIHDEHSREGIARLYKLISDNSSLHLYLTYHIAYGSGVRILTFSTDAPLPLIYREMQGLGVVISNS